MDVIYFAQQTDSDSWVCEGCVAFDKYDGNGCTKLNKYFGGDKDNDSFCVDNCLRYVEVEKSAATHHALVTEEEILSVAKVSEALDIPLDQIDEVIEKPVLPFLEPTQQFVQNELGGVKADGGKVRPTLLLKSMPNAIKEILEVLEIGAKKYSEDNWKKVEKSRYEDAVLRHLVLQYLAGEKLDNETKKHHLAHAACCILFMLELELTDNNN